MTRYRWALAALVALVVIAGVVYARSAAPAGTSGIVASADRAAAPEFTGIDAWVNSQPLTLSGLRGHVVLIDFWTFSCVNCVRTIPHLRALDATYGSRGLVIVGVHSPEFDFERSPANVAAACVRLGVTWPVAVDSQMATWNAWNNNVWPAEYLIDQRGRIAYQSLGEGDYDATAHAVATLLGTSDTVVQPAAPAPANGTTPELYAGSERGALANGEGYPPAGTTARYPVATPSSPDAILLTGAWSDHGQYVQAEAGGAHVLLLFHARDVYIVAGPAAGAVTATVRLDGDPVGTTVRGPAVDGGGDVVIGREDLFHLVSGVGGGDHLIDITVPRGFRLFTFTFG